MDQAEALLQSHRIEDISEKTEPNQMKKIFSTIFWFSNHTKVEPKGTHEEENGKVKAEPNLESIEGPIIEVNTEDKDPTYYLFSYSLLRNRLHAYIRQGKNLAVDFGSTQVLTVDKEVVVANGSYNYEIYWNSVLDQIFVRLEPILCVLDTIFVWIGGALCRVSV